jgi:hypothetical protein
MPVNMSYPKPRNVIKKYFQILRTDSATEKCILPKDAIVTSIKVTQTSAAATAAATFDLGWSGDADSLIDGFSMAVTTAVGQVQVGATVGLSVGTKLDADRKIISTYIAGSSTAGGEGWVELEYFVPGAGETHFS